VWRNLTTAKAKLLFRQHNDATALRSFICEAGKLRCIGEFFFRDAHCRDEANCLAVA